jgi:hypothetical protein
MSFSAEMKDFFNAFNTTASVAGNIKDRKLRREVLEAKKKGELPWDEWKDEFPGEHGLSYSDIGSKYEGDDDDDGGGGGGGGEAPTETVTPDDEEAAVEVPPVMEPTSPTYLPPGLNKLAPPPVAYAAGGSIRTGTQKGRLPVDMSKMNKDLLRRWEKTQKDFGREFNIVSAYRDPKRNKKAGGAKKSQHIHGNAIDIDVSGLSKPERLKLIQTASANGFTGVGVYNNSLHFDVGGRRAWGPNYKNTSIPSWAKGTIDEHLSGKFGGGTRSGSAVAGTRGGAKIPAALPVEDTREASAQPTWRDRLRQRTVPKQSAALAEEDADYAAEDYETGYESALPMPMGGSDEEQDTSALDAFYENEGIDVSAIDVPEPRPYRAVNLTSAPQPAFSTGGTVPWAGQTSYVRQRPGTMGGSFQRRPYVPKVAPAAATPNKRRGDDDDDRRSGSSSRYTVQYQSTYKNTGGIFPPQMMMLYGYKMADGGAVPGEPEEETAIHEEEIAATTPAIPEKAAPPVTSAGNPSEKKRVTLGQAIDLGLKHLSGALGLDRAGAAVGPDPDLRKRRAALVRGDIGAGEPPPTPKEMDQVFKTVDPDGRLNDNLRTIYAMRKGVEFYMTRGQPDKAAKWAAGLIQFSNLVSRQYGIEAVKAGRTGDMEAMVQLAVKSYDAIPDGMNAQAKLVGGKEVRITRTDEEGNVVDTHRLTPQQVFQMATGISQGSGYFDALMEIADPTGKKGSKGSAAEQRIAMTTEGNVALIGDYTKYLKDNEKNAWETAVRTGNTTLQNAILKKAMDRAEKAEEALGEGGKTETRKNAARSRFKSVMEFASEGDQEAFEMALEAEDWSSANDIIRDAMAARPKPEKEQALTPGQQAAAKTKEARTKYFQTLLPSIKDELSEEEFEAWNVAATANEVVSLKELFEDAQARQTTKQKNALKAKRLPALKAMRGNYETRLSEPDKNALDLAFEDNDIESIEKIYGKYDAEERFNRSQEAINERITAKNNNNESGIEEARILDMTYSNYAPFMSEEEKQQWKEAVRVGKPGIIKALKTKLDDPYYRATAEEKNKPKSKGLIERGWKALVGGGEEAIPTETTTSESKALDPAQAKLVEQLRALGASEAEIDAALKGQ